MIQILNPLTVTLVIRAPETDILSASLFQRKSVSLGQN